MMLPLNIKQNIITTTLFTTSLVLQFFYPFSSTTKLLSPTSFKKTNATEVVASSSLQHEVFGFAPYWNFDKLQSTDFNTLTTLAYFDLHVTASGNLDSSYDGYSSFWSDEATALFKKAHDNGTRVVVTVTQMDDPDITAFLDNPQAQQNAISQITDAIKKRGIDGVNVDFESVNDLGQGYRDAFSGFVQNLTTAVHTQIPRSQVSVSVLASSVKEPKIYDIAALSKSADEIFMMAYDFATTSSDNAMPTDPLYGYKQGQYWYDVSTAVSDFLTQMPANKLVLGIPWYGYNYPVSQPQVNAQTLNSYYDSSMSQPYEIASDTASLNSAETGWDNVGESSWKAYYDPNSGTWRMVFYNDPKALTVRMDFIKKMNLAGMGIWALGFDDGKQDLWKVIESEFGTKLADNAVVSKPIATEM